MILLWGSNAREAHPIFFHHVLKAIHGGAQMYAVDPRRTTSAQWADAWLGLNVGSDIALANAMAREIIHAGLAQPRVHRARDRGLRGLRRGGRAVHAGARPRRSTGVPADVIRTSRTRYARADRAQICWTLGITEHHNAVDNVLALINLALLTGHVGRYGSGLNPLRGQNNVQGGGDMGAIPNRLPGFQDLETDPRRVAKFERAWGVKIKPKSGWHMTEMFEAMERGELTTLFVLGENPVQSDADAHTSRSCSTGLEHLVVQDIFLHRDRRDGATSCCPPRPAGARPRARSRTASGACSACRKALEPPGHARDDMRIIVRPRRRAWATTGSTPTAEDVWNELRSLAPNHAGMSYARLEELGGIQWPCYDEDTLEPTFLHGRLWKEPRRGPAAPFPRRSRTRRRWSSCRTEFPLRLTTGRRLDSFNTGVQTGGYTSPLRRGEELELSTAGRRGARRARRRPGADRRRAAAEWSRPCASTRRCARAWRS